MMRGMERGIHKMCGHVLLEPYTSSLQVSCHYTSAKSTNILNLPKLPVPKLSDTLQKYLKSVRPHLNDDEFATTTSLVKDFECGVGQKLQNLLLKRAENSLNWLEEWWLNTAYLGYRDPVTVFSSPGLVFPFRKFNNEEEQLRYAAKTLLAALEYKDLIDNDKIPQEKMGKNPLDMAQYKKIFGTCRIPWEKIDKLSYNTNTKHVTVIHNNHFFHVDLWGDDNVLLSEAQIVEQLNNVIAESQIPACDPIGVLTSENRDTWAKAYQLLIADDVNKASLKDIETSIVVLCLDAPVGLWDLSDKGARQNLAASQTIFGGGSRSNGNNRWFDKTVQFIVGADGLTGLTYEHSPAEGQPIAVLTDYLINYVDKCKTNETPSSKPKCPKKLQFNVSSEVTDMINVAQINLDKLVCNLELNCFTYDRYGKNFIKSQKMSPDSYLQMAMQYAFYRIYKIPAAHYESAATRMYVGGRTETIRSCSIESIDFAKKMLDDCVSPKEKVAAMKKAIQAHKDYTVQALQGFGVDRHLLGLKLTAIENGIELPKLYSDAGFVKSSTMRISTSQVACKCDGFMCYAPLVPNGYATCYNPRDNDVNFATSAFVYNEETSCDTYRSALEDSLQDMHDTLLKATPSKL
ncbi:carnitine O-acetyltransferase-like [Pectinophora gossypiella]|uniref:carnitine O-acetyltransferase-like n=1 Tax=Pectinophora gossypiella TaxID=13191 RepID=UPI00214EE2DD|nr:carnitine O-acetyltransferase-like [Pectinophora gossypiella]XP_049865440.1 carnitine O-acetyltransferase-like [Pectinophora gossypiella]XP_049865443.1 carnitine O-acetyltransferase-like [Pectinophora gossypiella]XP_049865444.1 carnitine O-acetyltransferase-like [Pectinophora gossypiella]XP_049865449.1 carnitine O-acetyltransferase-like [Pectinophora gossypiella]XP_049865457.1 carnitine O-acetyltransferase-like [Pectinophora gossypiella]XP_049865463.1 carnitine O-acetyltransferase-like [Pe